MPVLLKREDGESTPFRNAEYLPAYYFMPHEILSRCGKNVNFIPRNPQKAYQDKRAVEIIERDLFDQSAAASIDRGIGKAEPKQDNLAATPA